MLVSCKMCHRDYVASKSQGEHYICSKCQVRYREQHNTKLGLHPALERIWAHNHDAKSERAGYAQPQKSPSDFSNKHASLSDALSIPKIPGFDISYQIGRGAMGSVYRARQIKTGKLVAIKVLSYDLSERADLVARFEREAYALKSLTNPNVVSIIDAGHVENIHYFAMEFIDGITLRTRITREPIPFGDACFITAQILQGLKAAHKHGIIHRDLKPENVLLEFDDRDFSNRPNRGVLVDFGLVGIGGLAFDPHPNLTRSKVTMGTVNYMAPEQHIDAKRVDHRSDLYSAGVMFFEMLTGELPLGRYLLPHERGMDVPKKVDEILAIALSRKVEDRYFSADHFLKDLTDCEAAQEIIVSSSLDENKLDLAHAWSMVKSHLYKSRYALLVVIAGLFFALGIRLSLAGQSHQAVEQEEAPIKVP
jgi:eukaryotic-like serine/threonine-protein kinase